MKISKFANIYDTDGNLLRHVGEDGILPDYTLKELSDLVDKLGTEKGEDGKLKDPQGFNNASKILMQMLSDPKYDKERKEMLEEIKRAIVTTAEEKENALKEVNKDLEEYTNYEEVA